MLTYASEYDTARAGYPAHPGATATGVRLVADSTGYPVCCNRFEDHVLAG
jgi:hypothetical protein